MNTLTFEFPNKIETLNKKNFKHKLKLKIKNLNYDYRFFFEKSCIFLVIGRPIISESVNFRDTLKLLNKFKDIKKINGEFLIIKFNLNEKKLEIINDRFSSIPFFYFKTSKYFFGSLTYVEILKKLNSEKNFSTNEYKIYEFLRFQRIFGSDNYDKISKSLLAYNKLIYKNNKIYLLKYWRPKFNVDNNKSIHWYANKLNFLIDQSISRKFSGNEKKLIFFLSGGIDSRSIFSKVSKKIKTQSLTIATKLNNEAKIAKNVSSKLKIKNNFFALGSNPYKSSVKQLSMISNGISSFDHSIFNKINKNFFKKFDISSSGWGLDIFFQGLYIPTIKKKIFNFFPTFFLGLDKSIYKTNLANFFLNNISYRNKEKDLFQIIKPGYKKKFENKLNHQIKNIYKHSKFVSNDPVNVYNHMTINNISRHYSMPNLLSMSNCKKNTCIMFDNDLLEFYYTIPHKFLVGKKLYRLFYRNFVSKNIASIKTGNENIKFDLSPFYKTFLWYFDKILIKLKIRNRTIFYNPAKERTWPARNEIIKHMEFKKYLINMTKNSYFDRLDFIDKEKLRIFLKNSINKNDWYAASTVFYLITINELFKGS